MMNIRLDIFVMLFLFTRFIYIFYSWALFPVYAGKSPFNRHSETFRAFTVCELRILMKCMKLGCLLFLFIYHVHVYYHLYIVYFHFVTLFCLLILFIAFHSHKLLDLKPYLILLLSFFPLFL